MDKAKKAEYMRQWRAAHPEWADYMRQYRQAHKDKIISDHKVWRQRNQKRNADLAKRWYHDNPLLSACVNKAAVANRRFPGTVTPHDILDLIERSGRKCHWCGKDDLQGRDLTLEHLKPLNDLKYLVIACLKCNASKLAQRQLAGGV